MIVKKTCFFGKEFEIQLIHQYEARQRAEGGKE
jgi:hypothetical protein